MGLSAHFAGRCAAASGRGQQVVDLEDRPRSQQGRHCGVAAATSTFGVIATEFIDKMIKEARAEATLLKAHWLLEEIAAPLRNRPIAEVTPPEILAVLRAVEVKGHYETARRSRSIIGQVFRYAIATSRA